MKCPRDKSALVVEKYRGIEVDRCPTCRGLWLDQPELGMMEGQVAPSLPGKLMHSPHSSNINCPHCESPLTQFKYRGERLAIDTCNQGHGFWLDYGEEKDIMEFMRERIHNFDR